MTIGISFKAKIVQPTAIQEEKARTCKNELCQIKEAKKENQLSDIAAMTAKMNIEAKLQETKTDPIKYVEEIDTNKNHLIPTSSDTAEKLKPKTVTDVIAKFHNKTQPSKHERDAVLLNQMNMFAASNMILHGLI